MEMLKCDICGGKLVMQAGGVSKCDSCGMEYSQERMREKVQEIKGVVKIDGPVKVESIDFIIRGGVLEKYNGQSVDVVVPDTVVDIAMDAFVGCQIRSLVIPESVKRLTARMPQTLERVIFSEGLEMIGDNVFYGCTYLNNIEFPNSLKTIGASAFQNCTSIERVHLPESVTFSGWRAFWYCSNLTDVQSRYLQQFCTTPWGIPIENELTAYLRRVIEERKKKKACPYCGNKIKYLYAYEGNIFGDRYYGCGICDYEYHKNFSYNGEQDYNDAIEQLKSQPLSDAICNNVAGIEGGGNRLAPAAACKAFSKLIIDYLSKRGLQW